MSGAFLRAAAAGLVEASREFAHLAWTVFPYFLVGAVAGAAVQAFLPRKWSERAIGGRGIRPLLAAVAAAALLPGCSCATMPMASGLKDTRAPRLGTTTAFIFMSPLLSPVTVALTWAMLGWRMTAARVVASFAGSVLLGLLVNRFERWFGSGISANVFRQTGRGLQWESQILLALRHPAIRPPARAELRIRLLRDSGPACGAFFAR